MSNKKIVVIPGDGIGEEITGAAVRVLKKVAAKSQLSLTLKKQLAGGGCH